jgi:hypothetical protein
VPVSENIQPNTEITGSISITATGTATSASFLANRLVIETAAGTSSQPTLTFTSISLVKTTSAVTASGSTLSAQLNWLKNNATSNHSYILTANASETIAPQNLSWSDKNNIMVFLQGDYTDRTISLSAQGAMFTVGSGLTLILDNNITLKGRSDNNSPLLHVNGNLIINNGATITENANRNPYGGYAYGGGVSVDSGGYCTMNGGEISNTTNYGWGGGMYINGSFFMNGGKITNNTVIAPGSGYSAEGPGMMLHGGSAVFIMNGGEISYNTLNDPVYGGTSGIVHAAYASITMNGGSIHNNTGCGGVSLNTDCTFVMNDGSIANNTNSRGGGIYIQSSCSFIMKGGSISGNAATYGGGIFLLSGTFRISGGIIYGSSASSTLKNTAGSSGAALYKYSSATAEYGVYSGETFYPSGVLNTSEDTIRVQNGNLYNN